MLFAIFGVVVFVLLVCLGVFVYSGLLARIVVKVGPAPYEDSVLLYKFFRRPYKQAGSAFQEVTKLFVGLTCVGIYYDDPDKVEASKLRHCVGIIAKGNKDYLAALENRGSTHGYSSIKFPSVSKAMLATFPFKTILSIYLSIYRVYPALQRFVEEHKIAPHPYIELYQGSTIHFIAPLECNKDFYVPEFVETEKDSKEKMKM